MQISDSFRPNHLTGGETSICTLFEGDYHYGLAALVNSLVKSGFRGTMWAGYRGRLPQWLNQLQCLDKDKQEYLVADIVKLHLVRVETHLHFTNYKPQFMLNLFASEKCDCSYMWYFDPDICVAAPWSFFEDWQRNGIALCQEIVDNILPHDAPLRQLWMRLAAGIGLVNPRSLNCYYNGGVVGVPARCTRFLENWKQLIALAGDLGCDLTGFMPGNRRMPFHATDQDALNIAAMYSDDPLTTLGPQGMGFIPGDNVLYHAIGQKPWRGSFLLRAFQGFPPSAAMKYFLTQSESPICAYSPHRLHTKRLACGLAAMIGRFYRRI